jgi:hypothetical protein
MLLNLIFLLQEACFHILCILHWKIPFCNIRHRIFYNKGQNIQVHKGCSKEYHYPLPNVEVRLVHLILKHSNLDFMSWYYKH